MIKKMMHRMMVFMSKRMIACDEASYLMSYREENPLNFKRRMQVRMHLLSCHLCRKYEKQLRQLNSCMDRYRATCDDPACMHHLPPEKHLHIEKVLVEELGN
jgi:hypothetical protein